MTPQLPVPGTPAGRAGLAAVLADPATALVALDYDGTLAPVVARPADARPAAGALDAVAALAARVGTVAVITGRPVDELLGLAGLSRRDDLAGLVVLGHYGLERWDGASRRTQSPPPTPGVGAVRAALPGVLDGADPGVAVEDKGHSLAVHTRGAHDPGGEQDRLRGPLAELAARHGLEVVPGRRVLELRPPGTDKGSALTGLVAERAARSVVVAGDDLGDLPAYDAVDRLRGQGLAGLLVASGSEETDEVARRADLVVDGPQGVLALLTALAAALG